MQDKITRRHDGIKAALHMLSATVGVVHLSDESARVIRGYSLSRNFHSGAPEKPSGLGRCIHDGDSARSRSLPPSAYHPRLVKCGNATRPIGCTKSKVGRREDPVYTCLVQTAREHRVLGISAPCTGSASASLTGLLTTAKAGVRYHFVLDSGRSYTGYAPIFVAIFE
jgi:hypothetical protein